MSSTQVFTLKNKKCGENHCVHAGIIINLYRLLIQMPGRHTWSCRGHLLGQFHLLSSYSKTRCTLLWDYETLQQYLLVRGRENTHPLPSPTVSLENQSYNPLVTGHYWREIGSRYEIQSTPKKSQEGSTTENQTVVMSLLHNANNLSQHLWGSTLTLQSPRQESAVVFYLFVKSLHVTSPYVVVMWCWLNTPFQKKGLVRDILQASQCKHQGIQFI